jgi:hypothetical protein
LDTFKESWKLNQLIGGVGATLVMIGVQKKRYLFGILGSLRRKLQSAKKGFPFLCGRRPRRATFFGASRPRHIAFAFQNKGNFWPEFRH